MDDSTEIKRKADIAELAKFASFVQQLVNAPSIDDFLDSSARCLARLLDTDFALIHLVDPRSAATTARAFYVHAADTASPRSFSHLCDVLCADTSVSSLEGLLPVSECSPLLQKVLHQSDVVSIMRTPLRSRAEYTGFIVVGSGSRQLDATEYELVQQLSAVIISCLAKDRHAQQAITDVTSQRSYTLNLEVLNFLAERLSSVTDLPLALEAVESTVRKLIDCDRISYCELAADRQFVRISALRADTSDRVGQLVPLADTGLEEVLVHGRYLHRELTADSCRRAERSLYYSGYRHKWSIPVPANGRVRAAMTILARVDHRNSKNTRSILTTLARLFGSALERIDAQTETERKQAELEKRARTDALTGLANRYEFESVIERLIQSSRSGAKTFGVMYLDVDLFKHVNDTLGHAAGDILLCTVADRLQRLLKPHDLVARIGGDEFLLLVNDYASTDELCQLAESALDSVRQTTTVMKRSLQPSLSIGICEFPRHGASASELLRHADIAMYEAKKSGRNRFQVFDEELASSLNRNLRLVDQLREAISNDELFVLYQPKVSVADGEILGVEALLRWRHPQQGLIPPDVFIPIAEQHNLIAAVTNVMLHESFAALATLRRLKPSMTMAVNISAMDFSDQSNLMTRLDSALKASGLSAGSIELELTETAILNNPETALQIIRDLKARGFRLSLDDFGTGYSSLTYLVDLPIDSIKIDRSFVDELTRDQRKQAVINGLVSIAAGLNSRVIVEGVETTEQLDWLASAGCDAAQGYLISKPVPVERIVQMLDDVERSVRVA